MKLPEGPPVPGAGEAADLFRQMMEITARLRAPGGCPWDREQDLPDVVRHLAAEVEEIRTAVGGGDFANLEEELGDLLFNAIFLADLARERGRFDMAGALRGIRDKLVRRHPHVFAEPRELTAQQAWTQWERIKAEEKRARGAGGGGAA